MQNRFLNNAIEVKEEILSHLGNFAYDPINNQLLLKLRIVDLFLDVLNGEKEWIKLKSLSLAALANCCIDPRISTIISLNDGISKVIFHLNSSNVEDIVNSITILIFIAQSNEESRKCRY